MARIRGTSLRDTLTGTAASDTLNGYDGNDTIDAGTGHDNVSGGNGNDTLDGQDGNDNVFGGRGDDSVTGGNGNDVLKGDAGADILAGGNGNDVLYGGTEDDLLSGAAGDDVIYAGEGVDTINGGVDTMTWHSSQGFLGGDWLSYSYISGGVTVDLTTNATAGEAAGDTWLGVEHVSGSKGHDTLIGSATDGGTLKGNGGNDKITAGAASGSVLIGGTGRDLLTGFTGDDYFKLEYDHAGKIDYGFDRVTEFVSGSDKFLVSQKMFGDIGTAGSATLGAGVLVSGTTNAATTADTRFIFETDTQTLWYDADGTGTASEAYALVLVEGASGAAVTPLLTDFHVML